MEAEIFKGLQCRLVADGDAANATVRVERRGQVLGVIVVESAKGAVTSENAELKALVDAMPRCVPGSDVVQYLLDAPWRAVLKSAFVGGNI